MPFGRGALRSTLVAVAVLAAPPLAAQPERQCPIEGNINSKGVRIYHPPGCKYYSSTVIDPKLGERWFCSEQEAIAAGWRRTKVC